MKKRQQRTVDRFATAVDKEEKARAKFKRALRAYEKAMATTERLNKALTKESKE